MNPFFRTGAVAHKLSNQEINAIMGICAAIKASFPGKPLANTVIAVENANPFSDLRARAGYADTLSEMAERGLVNIIHQPAGPVVRLTETGLRSYQSSYN